MVFSSLEFLFMYLPVVLLLYFAVPAKFLFARNVVLLAVSLVFYGWGEPLYVLLMIFTIVASYLGGLFVHKFKGTKKSQRALVITAIVDLGILGFFKYYDFFVNNLRLIPGMDWLQPLGLALPIGISFYTFQSLSYVVDVYREDAKVQKNVLSFGAYVTMFPQLIAGPIVRYKDVDDQLRNRDHNTAMFADGIRTFMAGLAKKVLLANPAGEMWNTMSAISVDSRTVVGSWLGLIFYAFQIYFDFSAYSDMAIGLGKMLGFTFLENFNYPYVSRSITEFWRRWHISLSTWFKEYVYIPLGGNRKGPARTYLNLLAVWFLTGFWHGANWNYILWGLYFFVLLVIEKRFLLKALEKAPKWVAHIYTLVFVLFGWLLFVFEDMSAGVVWLGNMFGVGTAQFVNQRDLYDLLRNIPLLLILGVASTALPKRIWRKLYDAKPVVRVLTMVGCLVLLIVCTAYLVDSSFNPFLYFRF